VSDYKISVQLPNFHSEDNTEKSLEKQTLAEVVHQVLEIPRDDIKKLLIRPDPPKPMKKKVKRTVAERMAELGVAVPNSVVVQVVPTMRRKFVRVCSDQSQNNDDDMLDVNISSSDILEEEEKGEDNSKATGAGVAEFSGTTSNKINAAHHAPISSVPLKNSFALPDYLRSRRAKPQVVEIVTSSLRDNETTYDLNADEDEDDTEDDITKTDPEETSTNSEENQEMKYDQMPYESTISATGEVVSEQSGDKSPDPETREKSPSMKSPLSSSSNELEEQINEHNYARVANFSPPLAKTGNYRTPEMKTKRKHGQKKLKEAKKVDSRPKKVVTAAVTPAKDIEPALAAVKKTPSTANTSTLGTVKVAVAKSNTPSKPKSVPATKEPPASMIKLSPNSANLTTNNQTSLIESEENDLSRTESAHLSDDHHLSDSSFLEKSQLSVHVTDSQESIASRFDDGDASSEHIAISGGGSKNSFRNSGILGELSASKRNSSKRRHTSSVEEDRPQLHHILNASWFPGLGVRLALLRSHSVS
jgi:hypothetical protein